MDCFVLHQSTNNNFSKFPRLHIYISNINKKDPSQTYNQLTFLTNIYGLRWVHILFSLLFVSSIQCFLEMFDIIHVYHNFKNVSLVSILLEHLVYFKDATVKPKTLKKWNFRKLNKISQIYLMDNFQNQVLVKNMFWNHVFLILTWWMVGGIWY